MLEKLIPQGSRRRALIRRLLLGKGVAPPHVARNQRPLSPEQQRELSESLQTHYFSDANVGDRDRYLASPVGQSDLADHISVRLQQFRNVVVPWINSAVPLRGLHILEVGCGTGASTVALAEQGSIVTAIDIIEQSLDVARRRADLHAVDVNFVCGNSKDIAPLMKAEKFDCVAFLASLEHMTVAERVSALRDAWGGLARGGHLIVVESPNRLWYFDEHTAREPFFHWLPDELAFQYSRQTPRPLFNETFRSLNDPDAALRFARWGRSLSFHEFVVAFGTPRSELPIVSYLRDDLRRRAILPYPTWLTRAGRYTKFLQTICPDLSLAFCSEYIDVVFRK